MENWQKIVIFLYFFLNVITVIRGYRECKDRKNAFGESPLLFFLGMFVWGDAVIFGLFWASISLVTFFLNDWILFLLTISLFWLVRSLGETNYWINQQFSTIVRNPPEKLRFYTFFKNDSVWFVYQIIWQCVTVVSAIFTIYLLDIWLKSF